MDIEKHHAEFQKIIDKYNLKDEFKAEEIANFLTKNHGQKVIPSEFGNLFGMSEDEAKLFLSFIQKGIKFKEASSQQI